MIKVMFTSEDAKGYTFSCGFRSIKLAEKFENEYKYLGGFNRFSMDIYGDTNEKLFLIPCNMNGFKKVYSALYTW